MPHRHWPRMDPYVIAGEDQQTSGSGASPSSLPARTGGGSHSHLQSSKKKHKQYISLLFSLFFRSTPISLLLLGFNATIAYCCFDG